MSDLIDRQSAIIALEANKRSNEKKGQILCADEDAIIKWLNRLPSASEPKTGRWILISHLWECDKCGCRIHRANPLKGNIWNYNYCPNCGCKMEVEHG